MATNFQQRGETAAWTNGTGSAVSAGDPVVFGQQIAIALGDIADNATGEVAS